MTTPTPAAIRAAIRETRKRMAKMTREEKDELLKAGMRTIYGGKKKGKA